MTEQMIHFAQIPRTISNYQDLLVKLTALTNCTGLCLAGFARLVHLLDTLCGVKETCVKPLKQSDFYLS